MDKNDEILMDGIDERIEAFLRGEMTAEEEAAFKQEIRQNPELRSRAMAMTLLIKGLHEKNSEKETAIIKENTAKSRVRPLLWWACSVAAVFVIVFGIYKDHRYRMLDATVSPYYTEYSMSDVSRGDLDSATTFHLYDLFIQIQENRSVSDIIKELEPIYNSLDENFTYNAYANDIAWNLALAYVKDDQIDKAITILQKLKTDNPDTPIYNKVNELIKKLQEL
ncbi:MAG: hypothetical protein J6W21_01180 [Bacteroidaceae bacterium]|nr:hypothetical protein [Bacteroidaceae bacterium]